MNRDQAALARKQLDRRLTPLRDLTLAAPPKGWTKAIRESLGMTARQLAARMGVAPSRIPAIEKAEVTGATTLRTLRQAAAAMNCAFVYAFMPTEPLDDMLRERAMQKARKDVSRLDHSMRLENQALLKSDLDAEQQRTIDLILSGSLRGLWDEQRDHHV
jgi:predicted DNA-binding mobile mystery protein A